MEEEVPAKTSEAQDPSETIEGLQVSEKTCDETMVIDDDADAEKETEEVAKAAPRWLRRHDQANAEISAPQRWT